MGVLQFQACPVAISSLLHTRMDQHVATLEGGSSNSNLKKEDLQLPLPF